jgi:hypothetical protein
MLFTRQLFQNKLFGGGTNIQRSVGVSSLLVCSHGKEHKFWGIVSSQMWFFQFFFDLKMRPKNQNMKPQKRYLEVSRSTRKEVRAFFRFTAKRKI